ncbi:GntR family transcriptional regulator [Pseudohalocynthiibacter aestuariivivens]|uniref:GntR family transcriptional regulator n=1 Tax=Roseovarius pelagicus TaxID=2980108 RepID=A0ABY6DGZ4_9RHOB|nr:MULTISPECIES: GntR family transcriptional regulator [Rhodobacterales]QIE45006.1 GntR family transcriptional regulator [Pseudohalocynthiibacter aestuariivivens]UXX83075.1 GntR family transcriptional regulator [Roseovarius pelagicus]
MPRPEQTTLVNQVFDRIFDLLVSGEIPLGGIVNEAALAERFSVSRGPVREAVKQFQGRGLVIKEPYLKARVVELSVSDMVEIFQLREAVEGMSVRLATQNMTEAALDALLADFSQPRPDTAEVLDVHVRIAEGSGNKRIRALLCDELYYLLRLYRARSGDMPGRRENAHAEHWQILRAMKTRDADLAESLMRAHILRATHSLQELLAEETTALAMKTKGDAE